MAVLREGRAVDLRLLGMTYEQIAGSLLPCQQHRPEGDLDCSSCGLMYRDASGARRAVERALQQAYALSAEGREQLRQQHLGQIDMLLRRAMRASMAGNWEAVRAATALLDRRARLLGLDAPARHVVTTELDEEIGALMAELRAQERAVAEADQ